MVPRTSGLHKALCGRLACDGVYRNPSIANEESIIPNDDLMTSIYDDLICESFATQKDIICNADLKHMENIMGKHNGFPSCCKVRVPVWLSQNSAEIIVVVMPRTTDLSWLDF